MRCGVASDGLVSKLRRPSGALSSGRPFPRLPWAAALHNLNQLAGGLESNLPAFLRTLRHLPVSTALTSDMLAAIRLSPRQHVLRAYFTLGVLSVFGGIFWASLICFLFL